MTELDENERRIFRRSIVQFIIFMIVISVIFFVLYCIVYERCYNVMNEDELTLLKFCKSGGDIFIVIFGHIFKIMSISCGLFH